MNGHRPDRTLVAAQFPDLPPTGVKRTVARRPHPNDPVIAGADQIAAIWPEGDLERSPPRALKLRRRRRVLPPVFPEENVAIQRGRREDPRILRIERERDKIAVLGIADAERRDDVPRRRIEHFDLAFVCPSSAATIRTSGEIAKAFGHEMAPSNSCCSRTGVAATFQSLTEVPNPPVAIKCPSALNFAAPARSRRRPALGRRPRRAPHRRRTGVELLARARREE